MSGTIQASVVKDSASATNNLTLDASGNVTVGSNLTVSGTGNTSFGGNVGIGITPNAWSAFTALQMAGPAMWGSPGVGHWSVNTYYDGANYKYITTNYATDYYQFNGTHVWRYAPSGTAGTNVTSLTEAMRIDSSGNFMVGTTTVYGKTTSSVGAANQACFGAYFTGSGGSGVGIQVNYGASTGTGYAAYFTYNGSGCGSITVTSGATAYNTSSDYRLKENVQPMANALATIGALKPVTYNWISGKAQGEGFLAHELQAVIPLAVVGEKDAVDDEGNIKAQGVDYSKIVVHLVAALQEAVGKITALEDRITKLESGI